MPHGDYWCKKCYRQHKLTSKIGKEHLKYGPDGFKERWIKFFEEKGKKV